MYIKILLYSCLYFAYQSCAPRNAKAVREDRMFTLGLAGASMRMGGSFDVGANVDWLTPAIYNSFESSVSRENPNEKSEENLVDSEGAYYRKIKPKSGINPNIFLRYYPADGSAFFFGLGYSQESMTDSFDAFADGAKTLEENPIKVSYIRESNFISLPMGWAWIWDSGFSWGVNWGPSYRLSENNKISANGRYSQEDVDWIVDKLDSSSQPKFNFFGARSTIILGYSF